MHPDIIAIRKFLKKKGWNRSRLAREAKLPSHGYLKDVFENTFNPTAGTLEAVMKVVRKG